MHYVFVVMYILVRFFLSVFMVVEGFEDIWGIEGLKGSALVI